MTIYKIPAPIPAKIGSPVDIPMNWPAAVQDVSFSAKSGDDLRFVATTVSGQPKFNWPSIYNSVTNKYEELLPISVESGVTWKAPYDGNFYIRFASSDVRVNGIFSLNLSGSTAVQVAPLASPAAKPSFSPSPSPKPSGTPTPSSTPVSKSSKSAKKVGPSATSSTSNKVDYKDASDCSGSVLAATIKGSSQRNSAWVTRTSDNSITLNWVDNPRAYNYVLLVGQNHFQNEEWPDGQVGDLRGRYIDFGNPRVNMCFVVDTKYEVSILRSKSTLLYRKSYELAVKDQWVAIVARDYSGKTVGLNVLSVPDPVSAKLCYFLATTAAIAPTVSGGIDLALDGLSMVPGTGEYISPLAKFAIKMAQSGINNSAVFKIDNATLESLGGKSVNLPEEFVNTALSISLSKVGSNKSWKEISKEFQDLPVFAKSGEIDSLWKQVIKQKDANFKLIIDGKIFVTGTPTDRMILKSELLKYLNSNSEKVLTARTAQLVIGTRDTFKSAVSSLFGLGSLNKITDRVLKNKNSCNFYS